MRTPAPENTRAPSARLDREILALAVPSFLTTVTVPLVGIVDTALVGHLGPVRYIGAVSVGAMIFDTLFWLFGFLRMGTTAVVAQAYGAGEDARAGRTLVQSSLLALGFGLLIVLVREPLIAVGLHFAGGSPEVQQWARRYLEIRLLGAPFVLLTFALLGAFRGLKDARAPLAVTLVINLTNMAGDVVLIHGKLGMPRLEVAGAAWASLGSAFLGAACALGFLARRHRGPLVQAWHDLHAPGTAWWARVFDRRGLARLLRTHGNLFNRTLLLVLAYFVMVAVASRLGDVPLAANAVLLQLWYLAAYSLDGVALAAETLVGNALGAGVRDRTRALIRRLNLWGLLASAGFALAYLLGMRLIARLFTDDARVIEAIAALGWLVALVQPVNAIAFVLDGVFIGADDARFLSLQIALACLGVFVPAVLVLTQFLDGGLTGLWAAMALFSTARAALLLARLSRPSWIDARIEHARSVGD